MSPAESPQIISLTTVLSLASTLAILLVGYLSSLRFLPASSTSKTRFLFVWHATDALIHFILEGSYLHNCFFSSATLLEGKALGSEFLPAGVSFLGDHTRLYGAEYGTSPFSALWREYARADKRWGGSDLTVISLELLTVFVAGPMAVWICYGLAKKRADTSFWMIVLATGELYGGWMTFAPEWLSGSPNLNTDVWMYTWVYLFFFNTIWVWIPLWVLYDAYGTITGALAPRSRANGGKKAQRREGIQVSTLVTLIDLEYNDLILGFRIPVDGGTKLTKLAGDNTAHELLATGSSISLANAEQDETTGENKTESDISPEMTIDTVSSDRMQDEIGDLTGRAQQENAASTSRRCPAKTHQILRQSHNNRPFAQTALPSPEQSPKCTAISHASYPPKFLSRSRSASPVTSEQPMEIDTIDYLHRIEAVLDLPLAMALREKEASRETLDNHWKTAVRTTGSAPPRSGFAADLRYGQQLIGANSLSRRAAESDRVEFPGGSSETLAPTRLLRR
ncbi:hypothetical protein B0A48_16335 [Cryoendolithus antarcticus]|uniref:EXPERA domain-containing protein n=1 Tax=Cryoendolithus antarcticus TaxID=1507870 RepID=A0A1V8SG20_9PEZI|nr:hypothetical protein B0A48_16335 [Cryoendolithus antarcticus]